MRLIHLLLVSFLPHCANCQQVALSGATWEAPSPLVDFWEIPSSGPGACRQDQVMRLNTMFQDMQQVGTVLRLWALMYPDPDYDSRLIRDLAKFWFGVADWNDKAFDGKKKVMWMWMEWLGRTLLEKPRERKILVCDSNVMQIQLADETPRDGVQKLTEDLKRFLGSGSNLAFERWWWFNFTGLRDTDAWVRFPKATADYKFPPGAHQYPAVAHNREGAGLPFRTHPENPDFPTYCAGVREPGDTVALTISLEKRPSGRPTKSDKSLEGKMLILCPKFFENPVDELDRARQAPGTDLQDMKPAWLPWFHELFHLKEEEFPHPKWGVYAARDAVSVELGQLDLIAPLPVLRKSMFKKRSGRTWNAASCMLLAQYEMADPIQLNGYESETLRNPESWAWFAIAGLLSYVVPGYQNWATGVCAYRYPQDAFNDGDAFNDADVHDPVPAYVHPPPLNQAPPAKRHAAQSPPFLTLADPWQNYPSPKSDLFNAMFEFNQTDEYHEYGD